MSHNTLLAPGQEKEEQTIRQLQQENSEEKKGRGVFGIANRGGVVGGVKQEKGGL